MTLRLPFRFVPLAALAVVGCLAAGTAPASAAPKPAAGTTGTASVFKVNPVQSTGNEGLTDQQDSATAVPSSAYATVPLRNLDGSGTLTGKWVAVESATGAPATSASNTFVYDRSQDQFEQVMAYFWVNQAQEYIQSLGFGSTLPPVDMAQQAVKVDQYGGDNSYQTDKPFRIRYGKGGVDDAEDAEVIVHEYGHAVHAAQVPGFGASEEAGAIGEAFGDYLGVTVGLAADKQYGWAVRTPEACVADWDSVSYTAGPVHCLRRLDGTKTVADKDGEVHDDGEIWSRALWDIRNGYVRNGSTTARADTAIIDAQFDFAPDTSFNAAAKATYRVALARDGARAGSTVKAAFAARGITF
jgi:hypothetical protein